MPNAIAYELLVSGSATFADMTRPVGAGLPACTDTSENSRCRVIRINVLRFNPPPSPTNPWLTPSFGVAAEDAGWRLGTPFVWQAGTYTWTVRAVYAAPSGVRPPAVAVEAKSEWALPRSFSTTKFETARATMTNMETLRATTDSPITQRPGSWLWDFSDGDGDRHLTAMRTYWAARAVKDGAMAWPATKEATENSMRLSLSTYYNPRQVVQIVQNLIVSRIERAYNNNVPAQRGVAMPSPTLDMLQYRAQCKEFADRSILAAGGTTQTYGTPKIPTPTVGFNARPYMYAFYAPPGSASTHAAIVTGVKFSASGRPSVRITEANINTSRGGMPWSNPGGQIPWERTVGTRWSEVQEGFKPGNNYQSPARVVDAGI